jgi:hypothetical protein
MVRTPAPKAEPKPASVQKTDNTSKRIAFPASGAVLETPGTWGKDLVDTVSRKLHELTSTMNKPASSANVALTEGGPIVPLVPKPKAEDNKRIAFPSGMVLQVPNWGEDEINTLARELHSTVQTVIGLPGALYRAASDPASAEEKQKYGATFEHDLGPTGRVIDRMAVQPVLNALQDYKDGKISWDEVLRDLPEALGGAGGAVVTGKIAHDLTKTPPKTTPTETPTETPTVSGPEQESSYKSSGKNDYKGPMPKRLTGSDRLSWLNENLDADRKIDVARHELAHYDYAAKAGHPTNDMFFTVGHEEVPGGGFSQGRVGTLNTFWSELMKKAKTPQARADVATKYLKQLYAPEVVEEKQGTSPEDIEDATGNDRQTAEKFMSKKMGLSPDEAETVRNKVIDQLRQEIGPKEMKRYTHAANQITNNHYGKFVSPWAIDHYLGGGSYEDIADKLKAEDAELENSEGSELPELETTPDLGSILGRKK